MSTNATHVPLSETERAELREHAIAAMGDWLSAEAEAGTPLWKLAVDLQAALGEIEVPVS